MSVVCAQLLSPIQLFTTPWTVACQAPQFMGFSRQEYWSGLPCPPPGDLPDPGIKSTSLGSPALTGEFLTTRTVWGAPHSTTIPIQLASLPCATGGPHCCFYREFTSVINRGSPSL